MKAEGEFLAASAQAKFFCHMPTRSTLRQTTARGTQPAVSGRHTIAGRSRLRRGCLAIGSRGRLGRGMRRLARGIGVGGHEQRDKSKNYYGRDHCLVSPQRTVRAMEGGNCSGSSPSSAPQPLMRENPRCPRLGRTADVADEMQIPRQCKSRATSIGVSNVTTPGD